MNYASIARSERAEVFWIRQAGFLDDSKPRLWSWPMSRKPIHNEKSLSRTKKALGDNARNPTSDGCLSKDNRRLAWRWVSGLFDRFLIDVDRKYRTGCYSTTIAIYLRRVSPPSLYSWRSLLLWRSILQWTSAFVTTSALAKLRGVETLPPWTDREEKDFSRSPHCRINF